MPADAAEVYVNKAACQETMIARRQDLLAENADSKAIENAAKNIEKDFPVEIDWMFQDGGIDCVKKWLQNSNTVDFEKDLLRSVRDELGIFHGIIYELPQASDDPNSPDRLNIYFDQCRHRRQLRLKVVQEKAPKIVFTKHYNLGGSHYAYTEGLSDAQNEKHFKPPSALCILEMDGMYGKVDTLIADPNGVIRDPDISWDGKKILFSWKKSARQDDYHLYEMDVASRKVRQLTFGIGFADYEGCYLPNGDIMFNSTRCVQTVDCWWTEVSNLYTCDRNGKFLRRISFDQVHTNYPTVTADGKVIYTRWDYNDRGQLYPQPLFQMNPDGTGQTEFYGNNSWFPTTVMHARGLPDSQKIVCILSGHHSHQRGKLAIIDPSKGRQEASGVQLIAPMRETKAVRIDAYGQDGEQFQYPYPLSEEEFIVTYTPHHAGNRRYAAHYGIYFMTKDGRRELLAWDENISCSQPVPLKSRKIPTVRPGIVDYTKNTGTYYIQDIYVGPGLKGMERGVIKKLRVIALDFRAAGVRSNRNGGPAGGALVSTPISLSNGTWDVKTVLGDTPVYKDGSAFFEVPAKTPVYFQAVDADGYAVQTMRSWSTLQPGENFACVGCHESKDVTPIRGKITKAMKAGPKKLTPFYGSPRGFSFRNEVQPVLDKHCIKCHNDRTKNRFVMPHDEEMIAASTQIVPKQSQWNYTFDDPGKGWTNEAFDASAWQLGQAGFGKEDGDIDFTAQTPWESREIWLRKNFQLEDSFDASAMLFQVRHSDRWDIFVNGVRLANGGGQSETYTNRACGGNYEQAFKAGTNVLAVYCRKSKNKNFIDVALFQRPSLRAEVIDGKARAFSLLGEGNNDDPAGRRWSDSYLALTDAFYQDSGFQGRWQDGIVQWISVQSAPPMLAPYHSGAAKSKLIKMIAGEHKSVKLAYEEIEKIACWIDLLVPYCGDYMEANIWNEDEIKKYEHFLDKRKRMEDIEKTNIDNLIATGKRF